MANSNWVDIGVKVEQATNLLVDVCKTLNRLKESDDDYLKTVNGKETESLIRETGKICLQSELALMGNKDSLIGMMFTQKQEEAV